MKGENAMKTKEELKALLVIKNGDQESFFMSAFNYPSMFVLNGACLIITFSARM